MATVAAAAGLFAASATPAFADGYWETQTAGATGVSAWGTSTASGRTCDIGMHITDTKSDGRRAGVQVQWNNNNDGNPPTNYYRYNVAGSGTTVDRHIWDLDDSIGVDIYVREFVSEGAIQSGGHFVDSGDWVLVCEGLTPGSGSSDTPALTTGCRTGGPDRPVPSGLSGRDRTDPPSVPAP